MKPSKRSRKDKVQFVSAYGIHQLHIFIFVLALFHVLYCITTLGLGTLKVCFFRQFFRSVAKVDYLTLRHGFVISDYMALCSVVPSNQYPWMAFILLIVGAKLQVIITKMGLRIQERGDVVKGAPVVQPGDDLFWFNRPRLILFLIHIVLFTMGSTMKPAIFKEQVPSSNNSRQPETATWMPFPSQPGTPLHGMSPVHLLNGYRDSSAVDNSRQTSPRKSDADMIEGWNPKIAGSHSPIRHHDDREESRMSRWNDQVGNEIGEIGSTQREVRISMSDFSNRQNHDRK
ncbi:hypothetical protein C3L33_16750, partial [Rhododendron williamsianum]